MYSLVCVIEIALPICAILILYGLDCIPVEGSMPYLFNGWIQESLLKGGGAYQRPHSLPSSPSPASSPLSLPSLCLVIFLGFHLRENFYYKVER